MRLLLIIYVAFASPSFADFIFNKHEISYRNTLENCFNLTDPQHCLMSGVRVFCKESVRCIKGELEEMCNLQRQKELNGGDYPGCLNVLTTKSLEVAIEEERKTANTSFDAMERILDEANEFCKDDRKCVEELLKKACKGNDCDLWKEIWRRLTILEEKCGKATDSRCLVEKIHEQCNGRLDCANATVEFFCARKRDPVRCEIDLISAFDDRYVEWWKPAEEEVTTNSADKQTTRRSTETTDKTTSFETTSFYNTSLNSTMEEVANSTDSTNSATEASEPSWLEKHRLPIMISVVVAGVILVLALGLFIYFFQRRQAKKQVKKSENEEEENDGEKKSKTSGKSVEKSEKKSSRRDMEDSTSSVA